MSRKKISVIGINGIPARYGGFETLAENLVIQLSKNYEFTVYCSNIYKKDEKVKRYNGAKLIYLPIKANGIQSLFYDIIATVHAWFTSDVLLILGPAAGVILPLNKIFRKKLIVNHGGLDEWKREKYSIYQRKIIYLNHYISSKVANENIADNEQLKKSIFTTFNSDSIVIKYGGDHITRRLDKTSLSYKYPFLLKKYDLSISRAQVDNNLHLLLAVYKKIQQRNLVLISNWNFSDYGKELKNKYKDKYPNIYILDAIYEKETLNIIRSNTSIYIHSHSRCGTSPSLVEAMNYKVPIICYDVITNRTVTENKSWYFSTALDLQKILSGLNHLSLNKNKNFMYSIAQKEFRWEKIAFEYANIFN